MAAQTIGVPKAASLAASYSANGFYDEMLAGPEQARPSYRRLFEQLNRLGPGERERRPEPAMRAIRHHGITFALQPDPPGIEKGFPFGIIPPEVSARAGRRLQGRPKQG